MDRRPWWCSVQGWMHSSEIHMLKSSLLMWWFLESLWGIIRCRWARGGGAPDGISALTWRDTRELRQPRLSTMWECGEKACAGQEESSHKKAALLEPWSWIPSLQNWENKFIWWKPPSLWCFVMASQEEDILYILMLPHHCGKYPMTSSL